MEKLRRVGQQIVRPHCQIAESADEGRDYVVKRADGAVSVGMWGRGSEVEGRLGRWRKEPRWPSDSGMTRARTGLHSRGRERRVVGHLNFVRLGRSW